MCTSSIDKSFEKLKGFMFTKYNGCLIENSGFRWNGKEHASLEDAKKTIDQSFIFLQQSINRSKN